MPTPNTRVCGCSLCQEWPKLEARVKVERSGAALAMINKFVGSAYTRKDAVELLAKCPTVTKALRARDRLKAGEAFEAELKDLEKAEEKAA